MIGAFDEGQAGDDFRRALALQRLPPGAGLDAGLQAHHAEIAGGGGDGGDHGARPALRAIGHGETEMEAGAVAHLGVARLDVDMHRKRRLDIGEGGDDDAPDALGGVEGQLALVALGQTRHHFGLAAGPEGRTAALVLLDLDQRIDDAAALHQEFMHGKIDAIDIVAQRAEFGEQVGCASFVLNGHGIVGGCCFALVLVWRAQLCKAGAPPDMPHVYDWAANFLTCAVCRFYIPDGAFERSNAQA